MASVHVSRLSKAFGEDPPVLCDVELAVADGEFLVVTGPSGSGKTTLLRVIAGLEAPTAGTVLIGGRDVTDASPQARDVAMVFQDYALYEHKTALGNITFPLEVRRVTPEAARVRRARDEARHFRIEHLLDRKPGQLSAGHRQAVATARSVVRESAALLMDEPLAHLDARARLEGRVELRRLHRDLGATVLYVTNDQVEAMSLGDRIAVFDEGRLEQVDVPLRVYRDPANTMVAGFIGTPQMNLVPGELVAGPGGVHVLVGNDRISLDDEALEAMPGWRGYVGGLVTVGIRPQDITEPSPGVPFPHCLHGRVAGIDDHGAERYAAVDLGVPGVRVVARLRAGGPERVGDPIELEAAVGRVRCFDPATGRAV
jgi:multiple sugar transport system ATP-binding protein